MIFSSRQVRSQFLPGSISILDRFDVTSCQVRSHFLSDSISFLPVSILLPVRFNLSSCQVRFQFLPGSISILTRFYVNSCQVRSQFLSGSVSCPALNLTTISIGAKSSRNSVQLLSKILSFRSQFLQLLRSHFLLILSSCQIRPEKLSGSILLPADLNFFQVRPQFLSGSVTIPALSSILISIPGRFGLNFCHAPNFYINSCHFPRSELLLVSISIPIKFGINSCLEPNNDLNSFNRCSKKILHAKKRTLSFYNFVCGMRKLGEIGP